MGSWNSVPLEVIYQIFGWFAFGVWSISFYPQLILNYRRKSVVGLNFDFLVFNLTKHSAYLIYNASVFFSPVVQRQYHEKYGYNEMIPVAANDVAFSIHAVLLTAFTIFQVFIYERGTQKVSRVCIGITMTAWGYAAVSLILAWPNGSWLWLVTCFKTAIYFEDQAPYKHLGGFQTYSSLVWLDPSYHDYDQIHSPGIHEFHSEEHRRMEHRKHFTGFVWRACKLRTNGRAIY